MSIACIDYGAGNLASIANGLKKVGAEAYVTADPKALSDAAGIVLPGVGSFGDAMENLEPYRDGIKEAVDAGIPFLGICLGQQVLFGSSEEDQDAKGLGIFSGTCKRFTGELKVPHMGWNTIEKAGESPLFEGIPDKAYFYFVHSYYTVPNEDGVIAAKTDYGMEFASSVSRDNVFGTQFHPEKSSELGLKVLGNFVGLCKR